MVLGSHKDRYSHVVLRVAYDNFAEEVRAGLTAPLKTLPCKYFYDEIGSALFERICEVPEYYLPRIEISILRERASSILESCPADLQIVELGCGNSTKTRLLIDACLARQSEIMFYGIDIAPECLERGATQLIRDYPPLRAIGLVGEFADGLRYLATLPGGPRLVVFLGSTIGNFDEPQLTHFLTMLRDNLRSCDRFLLGVDLLKDPAVLVAAYDDAAGVTARFNLNLLARINRDLAGNFDFAAFRHQARFNDRRSRIEMHLESIRDQRVHIGVLGMDIDFRRGETIHTENCYKHSLAVMRSHLARHGFEFLCAWTDPDQQFCLFLTH